MVSAVGDSGAVVRYSRVAGLGINSRGARSTLHAPVCHAGVKGSRFSMPPRSNADSAFVALVETHLDSACNLARWIVRDPVLAEDVVQDAMLRALKYFPGFRGENARAWVLQIVRNVALTRLQKDAGEAAEGSEVEFEAAALAVAGDARLGTRGDSDA